MRLSFLLVPAIGLAAAAVAGVWVPRPAEALSCVYEDDFGPGPRFEHLGAVPVDAHPWLLLDCHREVTDCSFVAEDHAVSVDVVRLGECPSRRAKRQTLEFAPQEPLLPGRAYTLECSEPSSLYDASITTRASEAPASPPSAVVVREAWIEREPDALCSAADPLRLALDELDVPYLLEGGRIEVAYPDGQIFPLTADYTDDGRYLPTTQGPLELTPVAADGSRGETVRTGELRYREAVYIPCSVAGEQSPWALCVLAPVLAIGVANRRRRGAR